MATNYSTPGVYVEEISKFPPSVAQVETAIPAFVGYTDKYATEQLNTPVKIGSLLDYELLFGGAPTPTRLQIDLNENLSVKGIKVNADYLLYDNIRMFYANGGGDCFVVSVGKYGDEIKKDDLLKGLNALEKVDRPTLLVIPETVRLDESNSGDIHKAMLAQCNKLQDRFAVLDIKDGDQPVTTSNDPIFNFRENVGMNDLKYGAAYYPWLRTTLSYEVGYDDIMAAEYTKEGDEFDKLKKLFNQNIVSQIDQISNDIESESDVLDSLSDEEIFAANDETELKTFAESIHSIFKNFYQAKSKFEYTENQDSTDKTHERFIKKDSEFHRLLTRWYEYIHFSKEGQDLPDDWTAYLIDFDTNDFDPLDFPDAGDENNENDIYTSTATVKDAVAHFRILAQKLEKLIKDFYSELEALKEQKIEILKQTDAFYSTILSAIKSRGIVLPPSGAIVGVYASVDNERGVWKAPANVSLTAVKGPAVNITNEEQGDLNIPNDGYGKSINAVRAFTGKGTLVWGARTLAGNDNEWRYISVRRFFIMVEESVKRATEQFVFEPNDANTWVKVRAMIENFLTLQWRAGALAGAKPEQAFYVRVGLGQTMTAQDIQEGKMNVEIGMAAVRPAEFIILKFSHKMQES